MEIKSFNRAALWTAVFFFVALAAMAVLIVRQRDVLTGTLATMNWPLCLASFVALAAYFLLLWDAWHRTVRWMGQKTERRATYEIWFISQLGKYVPGRVMTILGRIFLAQSNGMRGAVALAATCVEVILLIITNLAMTVAMELFFTRRLIHTSLALWLPLLIVLILPALHPRIMTWGLNLMLRLFRREPVEIELSYGRTLSLALMYSLSWAIYGLSGALLLKAMSGLPWDTATRAMPAFIFSWLLGLVSFIIPGGLGVREGALVLLLKPVLPVAIGLAVSLVFRALWMTCELAGAALSMALRKRNG